MELIRSEKALRVLLHRYWMRGWCDKTQIPAPTLALQRFMRQCQLLIEDVGTSPKDIDQICQDFYNDGMKSADFWLEHDSMWV